MTGEIDPVSHKLGELDATVKTLCSQHSALFREVRAANAKVDAMVETFQAHTEGMFSAMDDRVDDLETFQTKTEEVARIKNRQTLYLFGAGGAAGGILSQAIEYLKGIGPT